ncbi:MAG TPA: hypothetical protein VN914_08935 [Polyangia bacterium]|nr:hypothetical protein [Polyangia bacterium]
MPFQQAFAGPAYPLETHVECADAMVEAQLQFPKSREASDVAIRAAQASATYTVLGGTKPSVLKIEWDRGFGEANAWEWKQARRRGHMKVLLFLRAGPRGDFRSLVLGVTGVPNDVEKDYEARRRTAEALWKKRKGDRSVAGCSP